LVHLCSHGKVRRISAATFSGERVVAGLLAPALFALAACVGGSGPAQTRWVGTRVRGGGPRAVAQPTGHGTPTNPATPAAGQDSLMAGIPSFPPAPAAEKITLPGGPDAAWLSRIPTTQKVAFLTIDDGWFKLPQDVQLVREAHIPVTLFLAVNAIRDNPGYFKQLQAEGAVIEAHTINHPDLKGRSADFQKGEICGSADQLGSLYGRRPVIFRPPGGNEDDTTLRVAHDCGMKAVFFWKETVNNGRVGFQEGHTVQPGDVILMHFRTTFVKDFLAALRAIHDAGLTPARLEDYIP
jgi:peptidoglycan/xylan/chitin deacetylase (PgdA/CDA1 family)